jgi:quinol-cytochrome oxidoreductase complex cytochrome b subunit
MRRRFVSLLRAHLVTYPTPAQINSFWNFGFLLGIGISIQICTGLLLALYYSAEVSSAYFSIFFLIREVYYGWSLRYFHSNGASFVFMFVFVHIGRSMFYGSYFYNSSTWTTGILILFLLIVIAFLGYVLPFGQMSFWGATVITNLLSPFPGVIEWLCGGYCVHCPTIKRFFVFHFVMSFILLGLVVLHLFYLHFHSSNNPLRINTNNKIPFFPYIFIKDFFSLMIILCCYVIQCHFGMSTLSHPDNALEACAFLTPLHIVPEWYFLCQYSILKAVPNKNGGFVMLILSVFCLFFLGEIRRVSAYKKVMSSTSQNKNTSLFFGIFVCFVVIGAQFPQEIFLSYARVLMGIYFLLLLKE